jgi:hypothetical protein
MAEHRAQRRRRGVEAEIAAQQDGGRPLAASSARVSTPPAAPSTRPTLVAPMLPLPLSRTSAPVFSRTRR